MQRLQCGQNEGTRRATVLAEQLLHNIVNVFSIEKMRGECIQILKVLGLTSNIRVGERSTFQ